MEATKSLSRSRLHRIPSFRSESDAEIVFSNEVFHFNNCLADSSDLIGLPEEEESSEAERHCDRTEMLKMSVYRRETLKRTKRESLQTVAVKPAAAKVPASVIGRGYQRGHQRSLSDSVCGTKPQIANKSTLSKHSIIGSPHHSPRKILKTVPGCSSIGIPETFVQNKPLAEGLLDLHKLRMGSHALSVTVPLQANLWRSEQYSFGNIKKVRQCGFLDEKGISYPNPHTIMTTQ